MNVKSLYAHFHGPHTPRNFAVSTRGFLPGASLRHGDMRKLVGLVKL